VTDLELIDAAIRKLNRLLDTCSPGPWVRGGYGSYGWTVLADGSRPFDPTDPHLGIETADSERGKADAEFIATMNPITAGAVVGLLTWVRDTGERTEVAAVLAQAILHHGGELS